MDRNTQVTFNIYNTLFKLSRLHTIYNYGLPAVHKHVLPTRSVMDCSILFPQANQKSE